MTKSKSFCQFSSPSSSMIPGSDSRKSFSSSFNRFWKQQHQKFSLTMKPSAKEEFYRDENMNTNNSHYGESEDLNSFFQKRHLNQAIKNFPEVRTKDGRVIDPTQPDFLMVVCKEMDRTLLRRVKDTPLPPYYINFRDANGWVSLPLSYWQLVTPLYYRPLWASCV